MRHQNDELVFVIYTRDDVPLELDADYLKSQSNCLFHLITTNKTHEQIGSHETHRLFEMVHCFASPSEVTEASVVAVIDSVCRGDYRHVDVVTLSESSVEVCGRVKNRLGLIEDDYSRFVYKDKMKSLLSGTGVHCPKYVVFDPERYAQSPDVYLSHIAEQVGIPCFVKPVNLYGNIGAAKIPSTADLETWARNHRRNDYVYEIDEYIDGTVYQCDSVVCNGETEFCQVSVSARPWVDVFSGCNVGIRTVEPDDPNASALAGAARTVNKLFLDGMSGVTCIEFFARNAETIFLEIAYRPAGAGMSSTSYFLKGAGVAIKEAHILAQVAPNWRPPRNVRDHVALVVVPLPARSGTLKEVSCPEVSCNVHESWNIEAGGSIGQNNGLTSYAGTVLLWSAHNDELSRSYRRVLNECRLVVGEPAEARQKAV